MLSTLYDSRIQVEPPAPLSGDRDTDFLGAEQFRRFADNEYEAHTDTVKPGELRDWQDSFAYLRINGTRASENNENNEAEEITEQHLQDFFSTPSTLKEDKNSNQNEPLPMRDSTAEPPSLASEGLPAGDILIKGCKVALATRLPEEDRDFSTTSNGGDACEEIIASHGVLEEILDQRYPDKYGDLSEKGDSSVDQGNTNTALEPIASQQQEVLDILVDAVWPDIVHKQLEPLIRQLVLESRQYGPELYSESVESPTEKQNQQDSEEGVSLFEHGW